MKKILIVLALLIPLGGCANLQRVYDGFEAITTTTVSPKAIVIGANSALPPFIYSLFQSFYYVNVFCKIQHNDFYLKSYSTLY